MNKYKTPTRFGTGVVYYTELFFFYGWTAPLGLGLLSVEVSKSHLIRLTTLSRTLLDDWWKRPLPDNTQHS
jgi:hypothetical protein